MPGAFHTEVVPADSSALKIYLLDMNWKNPTVKDSFVQVVYKKTSVSKALLCKPQRDHFLCLGNASVDLKSGKLEIIAQRDQQKGNSVVYDLPLQLEVKKEDAHGHHH